MTTREFGPTTEYGISVYALEKNKMIDGNPNARAVQFFLDWNDRAAARWSATACSRRTSTASSSRRTTRRPDRRHAGRRRRLRRDVRCAEHLGADGASGTPTPDGLARRWPTQLPVAAFDSIFPCAPTSRDCLPQPGITNPAQYLDILSYRQRPTWRLAYRNFGTYESLVTNQSVEAPPGSGRRALVRDPARPNGSRTRSTSRAPTPRTTACTAGWAASPRTRRATWRWATASSTATTSSRHPLHRAGWPATRWAR